MKLVRERYLIPFILATLVFVACATQKGYERIRYSNLLSFQGVYTINTMMLYTEGNMDYSPIKGNSFYVNGLVITCDHLVWEEEQNRLITYLPFGPIYVWSGNPKGAEHWIMANNEKIPLKLVMRSTKLDLAILKPEKLIPEVPYTLGDSDSLSVGTNVFMLGNPQCAFNYVRHGIIASLQIPDKKEWRSSEKELDYNTLVIIDGGITHGDSGSPVLAIRNGEPEIIGVCNMMTKDANLFFATKINELKKLIEQIYQISMWSC